MKKKRMHLLSAIVIVTVLLCFTTSPFQSIAFSKNSEQKLPHTGAFWKSWGQVDSAWGSQRIGTCTGCDKEDCADATMANEGCLLTSMAMAAKSYGARLAGQTQDTVTPLTFVQKCIEKNAVEEHGSYKWSDTSRVLQNFVHIGSRNNITTVSDMTSQVKTLLDDTEGHYVVVICFGSNHFVVADHVQSNTLYVYDAGVGAVTTLQAALNRKDHYSLTGYHYFEYTGAIRGDVDGNGDVDSTDARLVLQHASNIQVNINTSVADFDALNGIDSNDSRLILQNATLM